MAINSEAAMALALFVSTASIVWSAAFAWSRWLVRPRESVEAFPEHREYLEQRIARLERTVDVMTGELARIGEAQRTVGHSPATGLSLQNPLQRPAGELRRVDTPH